MPRLAYVHDVVWELLKFFITCVYTVTVGVSFIICLYFSFVAGNVATFAYIYSLVGVMLLFKWWFMPKGEGW